MSEQQSRRFELLITRHLWPSQETCPQEVGKKERKVRDRSSSCGFCVLRKTYTAPPPPPRHFFTLAPPTSQEAEESEGGGGWLGERNRETQGQLLAGGKGSQVRSE